MLKHKKYNIASAIFGIFIIFSLFISLPIYTFADHIVGHDATSDSDGSDGTSDSDGLTSKSDPNGLNLNFKIENPLNTKITTFSDFVETILNIVLTVGVPIVALAIIYCGFLFVKAQGKSEEIKKAKAALMYTIIGAALLLGAWVLAKAIGATVKDIISTT